MITKAIYPLFMFVLLLSCCSRQHEIKDFSSDGCSLFPDKSLIDETDWCDCCFVHDIAYWQGGTEKERLAADEALKQCIIDKTGDEALAKLMFEGVRVGGSPYFYNWYRWGYGWNYERKYQALTEAEKKQVEEKLKKYLELYPKGPCGGE